MKTLVIGGTGTVGTQVIAELRKRGSAARVMSRTAGRLGSLPEGVEGVVGDLQRPETLAPAFDGVDALFLATALAPDEITQGLNAVEAARAAGLKQIVFMSVHRVDEAVHIPHFAGKLPIEGAAKASGMAWTILRPNNFYQNDWWVRDAILQHGVYPQPLSERGMNRVDVRDIAEAAAISITQPGHAGRTYSLVGPEAVTGASTAATYAKRAGRPVHYVGGDLAAWAAAASAQMPAWMVLDLKIMYAHFLEHGLTATAEEVEKLTKLLGHAPRSFDAFAKELIAG
jgi:uncharacterized protein YbjT (DUF2867 family)